MSAETQPRIAPERVVLEGQPRSRALNNELALADWHSEAYSVIDEEAFFASTYTITLADDLVLPPDPIGYRYTQAELPDDATIEAIAAAIGLQVSVHRYLDLPDQPDFDPPEGFAFWEAFDTSTGQWLTANRNGVWANGLPVQFDFRGPSPIFRGFSGVAGDTGPLCEFTSEPIAGATKQSHCAGDYAVVVDQVALPSEAEAEAIAASIVKAADPTVGELRFDTSAGTGSYFPSLTVSVQPVSLTSPLGWSFEFGPDGNLLRAGGNVGTLDVVDSYPLVGLDEAIERLRDVRVRWLAPAGIEPRTAQHPAEPATREITVIDVEPALWSATTPGLRSGEGGHWYWLPAYAFVDTVGIYHIVPAVTDDFLLR